MVECIRVVGKMMVLKGEKTVLWIDVGGDKIYKEEKGVLGVDLVREKEVYYLRGREVGCYHLLKNKERQPVKL